MGIKRCALTHVWRERVDLHALVLRRTRKKWKKNNEKEKEKERRKTFYIRLANGAHIICRTIANASPPSTVAACSRASPANSKAASYLQVIQSQFFLRMPTCKQLQNARESDNHVLPAFFQESIVLPLKRAVAAGAMQQIQAFHPNAPALPPPEHTQQ